MKHRVVAVIPAYNEERSIKQVAERTLEFADTVIVVDDGSRDDTARLASLDGEATVIRHRRNIGCGAALRTGVTRALQLKPDIVVLLDGDGQHNPEEIPSLVKPVVEGQAHLAVGERDFSLMPPSRKASNIITSSILRRFWHVPLIDVQCGFRAIRADAFRLLSLREGGYPWAAEMLIEAKHLGLKMAAVPIETIKPEKSNIRPLRDTLRFLHMLLREGRL